MIKDTLVIDALHFIIINNYYLIPYFIFEAYFFPNYFLVLKAQRYHDTCIETQRRRESDSAPSSR